MHATQQNLQKEERFLTVNLLLTYRKLTIFLLNKKDN